MNPLWLVLPVLLLLSAVAAVPRSRRRRLARLRATWGVPIQRARRMDAMSGTHVSRMATLGGASLDERTWANLNLKNVFAAIDRTQSTLGQHALYHRLRTAPLGAHLEAFEALVDRMTVDAGVRERAQMALARLQDPHGYDVWWLGLNGAVQQRSWYVLFPVLTASAIVLAALAPFWSSAVVPLVAVLVLNVAVHYATDFQIGIIARSFRQCAPLIATAESLGFLGGDDIDPIVSPLRTDVPALARLKLISRWVNGDPFMLPVNADPLVLALTDLVAAVYEYLNLAFLLDATGVYLVVKDLSRYGGSLVRATAAAGDATPQSASRRFALADRTGRGPISEVRGSHRDHRPASPTRACGGGELDRGATGTRCGHHRFQHVGEVDVSENRRRQRRSGTDDPYMLGATLSCACISSAELHREGDDLLAGKSYYIVEVQALLQLVRASDDTAPHLFLLDELFRGTNAVERIAAGQAVLVGLLEARRGARRPHVVLAATHDGELVDLVSETFDAYHFGDSVGPDGLTFDHRLQHGPATTRNAIALLRLHGAPTTLLAQAVTTAEMLDRQRGTSLLGR